jgi:hypothetical protein
MANLVPIAKTRIEDQFSPLSHTICPKPNNPPRKSEQSMGFHTRLEKTFSTVEPLFSLNLFGE